MPTITGKIHDRRQPLIAVRLSNAVSFLDGDELAFSPASEKSTDVWALIDTGATKSVIDLSIQRSLMLRQQATAPVLFPNMAQESYHPTYTCKLLLSEYARNDCRFHEWKDWPEVLAFDLSARLFKVVIGMDILAETELEMTKDVVRLKF